MQDLWEYLKETSKPILIYGTGNGADKILDLFNEKGILVSDIFTSNDFFREKDFRGFHLKPYSMIEKEYDDAIVVLAFAIFRDDMMSVIKEMNKRYEVISPCVSVFGTDYFSKDKLSTYKNEIREIYSMLADEKSRQVFEDLLKYRISGRLEPLLNAETDRLEVFENIIKLSDKERYLDLGAYRGDTIEEFLSLTNSSFEEIAAFEPDSKNYKKLSEYLETLDDEISKKIKIFNYASYSKKQKLTFQGGGGRNSAIGDGKLTVNATDIDSMIMDERFSAPTLVKMDVEGAEHETIEGMKNLIANKAPMLMVSAYHRVTDLFTLPLLVKSINPDYRVFLRHHTYVPDWETNYYFV